MLKLGYARLLVIPPNGSHARTMLHEEIDARADTLACRSVGLEERAQPPVEVTIRSIGKRRSREHLQAMRRPAYTWSSQFAPNINEPLLV